MKPTAKRIIVVLLCVPLALALTALMLTLVRGIPFPPPAARIGLVRVNNLIIDAEEKTTQLRDMYEDKRIAGVVLRINSPGGAIAPSQELFREVQRFRSGNKPLIVSMDNMAASGGYYIASAAHTIFANPGTLTGSIGVIMRLSRYDKLLDKIGVSFTTIKAGDFKDIGSPVREMLPRERAFLERLLIDAHEQFIRDVAAGRGVEPDSIRSQADGRIYSGTQALEAGLIDTLGTLSDALDYCRSLAGLAPDAKVYEKKPQVPLLRRLLGESFTTVLSGAPSPSGMYYLFQP